MSHDHWLDATWAVAQNQPRVPKAGYDSPFEDYFTSTGDCRYKCAHVQYVIDTCKRSGGCGDG